MKSAVFAPAFAPKSSRLMLGAVVAMDVEDFFQQGKRWWFRLHEKGGKRHDLPAHHKAEEYLDEYWR